MKMSRNSSIRTTLHPFSPPLTPFSYHGPVLSSQLELTLLRTVERFEFAERQLLLSMHHLASGAYYTAVTVN